MMNLAKLLIPVMGAIGMFVVAVGVLVLAATREDPETFWEPGVVIFAAGAALIGLAIGSDFVLYYRRLRCLLLWSSFLLITGHARTAYADTVIDIRPDGSIIAAWHDGVPLDVPLNVRLFQSETHQGQHVTLSIYYGVVGYQPNGEELIVWTGDASVYPSGDGRLGYWGQMTDTPSGSEYYYQPLSLDPGDAPLTADFDLYSEINQPTSISTIAEGHRLTIGGEQPRPSIFGIIADWFANPSRTVGQLFSALEAWFNG